MRLLIGTILFLGAAMLFTGFGFARLKVSKGEPAPAIRFESVKWTAGSDQLRALRQSFRLAATPESRTRILVAASAVGSGDSLAFLREVAGGAEDSKVREEAAALLSRVATPSPAPEPLPKR
jgi:hypothetical protein